MDEKSLSWIPRLERAVGGVPFWKVGRRGSRAPSRQAASSPLQARASSVPLSALRACRTANGTQALRRLWEFQARKWVLHSTQFAGGTLKYSAFEEAAVEASAGVKEIDAEIERLQAKRELLETKRDVLEGLVHQLLSIVPMSGETTADAPAAEQHADHQPEEPSYSHGKDEWSGYPAADMVPEAPEAEQPAYANLAPAGKPASLRDEGWRASARVDQRGIRELL